MIVTKLYNYYNNYFAILINGYCNTNITSLGVRITILMQLPTPKFNQLHLLTSIVLLLIKINDPHVCGG